MYKNELKEQIEALKLTQKICKTDTVNMITISREILRLTRELERIETEKKADIDKLTESRANAMYESIRRNKKSCNVKLLI